MYKIIIANCLNRRKIMKNNKRVGALIIALLMIVVVFTGCSTQTQNINATSVQQVAGR